jgi:DNA-binding transcriptional regulator YiaG
MSVSKPFSELLYDYMRAYETRKRGHGSGPSLEEAEKAIDAFFEVPELLTLAEDPVPADPGAAPVSGPTLAVIVGDREQMVQNTMNTFLPLRRKTDEEMEKQSRLSPGDRLRWLRLKSGRSMGDLARFLNCSVVEISQIERGRAVDDDED